MIFRKCSGMSLSDAARYRDAASIIPRRLVNYAADPISASAVTFVAGLPVFFDSITCINSWQSRLLHRATHVLCQWCNANWPVRIHHLHRPNWSGWLSDTYCNCSYFGFRECLEFTKSNATKNIIPPYFDVSTGPNYLD